MKSKARRELEKWAKGAIRHPIYLAEGAVFMYPSRSGEGGPHQIVVWMHRQTPKRVFEEFACSCQGFAYNPNGDTCWHIEDLKRQIAEGQQKATG